MCPLFMITRTKFVIICKGKDEFCVLGNVPPHMHFMQYCTGRYTHIAKFPVGK